MINKAITAISNDKLISLEKVKNKQKRDCEMEIRVKNTMCFSHRTICVAHKGAHCIVRSGFRKRNGDLYEICNSKSNTG